MNLVSSIIPVAIYICKYVCIYIWYIRTGHLCFIEGQWMLCWCGSIIHKFIGVQAVALVVLSSKSPISKSLKLALIIYIQELVFRVKNVKNCCILCVLDILRFDMCPEDSWMIKHDYSNWPWTYGGSEVECHSICSVHNWSHMPAWILGKIRLPEKLNKVLKYAVIYSFLLSALFPCEARLESLSSLLA